MKSHLMQFPKYFLYIELIYIFDMHLRFLYLAVNELIITVENINHNKSGLSQMVILHGLVF